MAFEFAPALIGNVDPQIWKALPNATQGYGYLYVLWFNTTDVVKVGVTVHPSARMTKHLSDAAALRVELGAAWFSEARLGYLDNEIQLIAVAVQRGLGERVRKEYFHGADFEAVAEIADRICKAAEQAPVEVAA